MVSRNNRFTARSFNFLRKKMKSFRTGGFLFLYGKDKYQSHVAVVISKKVSKKAVNRNRFRRRTYEVLRKNYLPLADKLNIICLYKGKEIPENALEIEKSVMEFISFAHQKQLIEK